MRETSILYLLCFIMKTILSGVKQRAKTKSLILLQEEPNERYEQTVLVERSMYETYFDPVNILFHNENIIISGVTQRAK